MSGVLGKIATAIYGVFDRAWTAVCWPLIGLLNLIFRPDPQTGAVSLWKVGLWLCANAVVLYLTIMDLTSRPLFWTLIAFLVVHILIMVSSLRIMYEEKRVMEGSLAPEHMTFSAFDAVNNTPILASSVFFYILGLAALIQTVEKAELASILKQRPDLMTEYAEYLACVINEVPIVGSVVNAWANLTDLSDNMSADIVYSGWTGNAVRLFIVATISIIVVRAILLRFQQWSQEIAMAHAIEEGTASPEAMQKRLVRMPTTLKNHLLATALTHPDGAVRRRAMAAMSSLNVPNFARELLQRLNQHLDPDLGLDEIRDSLSSMSSSAREALSLDLGPVIDKQMTAMKDAISSETKSRLEGIKSLLKRT